MTSQTVRLRVFASLSLLTLHARICLLASPCLSNSLNLHFEFYSDCYIDTLIQLLYCCLWRPLLMHMLLFYFYIDACNNRSSCSGLVLNRWVYMIHVGTLLVFPIGRANERNQTQTYHQSIRWFGVCISVGVAGNVVATFLRINRLRDLILAHWLSCPFMLLQLCF